MGLKPLYYTQNLYLCISKVDINGFCVSNVQNTIRLGWKTRGYLPADRFDMSFEKLFRVWSNYVAFGFEVLADFVEMSFVF